MDAEGNRAGVDIHIDGGTVAVAGEIDLATAGELADAIESIPDGPVALDLDGVAFIDSSGVGAIVVAHQRLAAAGRELSILRRSPAVDRVFTISGVDEILAGSA